MTSQPSKQFPHRLKANGLFSDLLRVPSIQRLHRISFLGAIDRIENGEFTDVIRSGSRLTHSVGVAELAVEICDLLHIEDISTPIAMAMVHDIGHGPLSHSFENYFLEEYGVSHKEQGANILETDRILRDVLDKHHVDIKRLSNVIFFNGKDDDFSFLFHNLINIDTIEGILRSADFFGCKYTKNLKSNLARSLASPSAECSKYFDEFWRLKSIVYNENIFDKNVGHGDYLLQYILLNSARVPFSVFEDTDSYVKERYSSFMGAFSRDFERSVCDLDSPVRNFSIDSEHEINEISDINLRYREHKNE